MTSRFRQTETRVKINPETYLKFIGGEMVLMQNVYSEQALEIKYDIMLILFELIDWNTVGNLIAPWPPGDQELIMKHLETLYSAKIIVCEESEIREIPESGLSDRLGSKVHINVENHHVMLKDYVRMASYRRAIENAVTENTIAMDLGCGTGVLSFFAAKAGAQHVYAIEKRPDIAYLAQELAKANGLSERITFIEKASGEIAEADIQPKPNLFISEILGNGILEENVLEFTLDAKRRFLAPDAQMIPWKLDIYVFGFDSPINTDRSLEVDELKDLYGFDFSLMGKVLCQKATLSTDRFDPRINKKITAPTLVKSVDFYQTDSPVFVKEFTVEALADGKISGFCGYFKAWLDEETILTNSPWAPQTHWTHLIYTLAAPRAVKKGDQIRLEMIYDGSIRIHLLDVDDDASVDVADGVPDNETEEA